MKKIFIIFMFLMGVLFTGQEAMAKVSIKKGDNAVSIIEFVKEEYKIEECYKALKNSFFSNEIVPMPPERFGFYLYMNPPEKNIIGISDNGEEIDFFVYNPIDKKLLFFISGESGEKDLYVKGTISEISSLQGGEGDGFLNLMKLFDSCSVVKEFIKNIKK